MKRKVILSLQSPPILLYCTVPYFIKYETQYIVGERRKILSKNMDLEYKTNND